MSSIIKEEEDLIIKNHEEEQEPEQIGDEEEEEPEEDGDGDSEDLTISNLDATIATPIASAPPPLNGTPSQQKQQQTPTTAGTMTAKSASLSATPSSGGGGDEARKLFQRLWTDEDEIGLLQGFLDFNTQRGTLNSSYHHETGPFYDHIKNRLNLDFNKSQLVEKLRRLKKKYRNVVARVNSGKEFNFKTPHDQTTFEISRKIWSGSHNCSNIVDETLLIMEDDGNNNNNNENNVNAEVKPSGCVNGNEEKVVPRGVMGAVSSIPFRKRGVKRAAEEELMCGNNKSVIEETVKSCVAPLIKELVNCAMNGQCNVGLLGFNGMGLNSLCGGGGGGNKDEVIDEKWRKQQILELEVYAKRVELVQEQIKSALEDLKSTGS